MHTSERGALTLDADEAAIHAIQASRPTIIVIGENRVYCQPPTDDGGAARATTQRCVYVLVGVWVAHSEHARW